MGENTITYKIENKTVHFFVDDEEVRTGAYQADDGTICMVRCPACGTENYAIAVATGKCAWCPFNPEVDAEEEK